jgi:S1-C subfamily serine protease
MRDGNRWPLILLAASGMVFAWSLAFAEGARVSERSFSPAEIAERTIPSVVLVKVPGALGSGFVVGDGLVVTNLHVIGTSREATVVLADGRELKQPEVLDADEGHDLVVLKVPAKGLKPLTMGDASRVRPGDRVVAIGHPLGLSNTVSDGLVSAVRVISPRLTVLQLSAPIAPGSSGGPLIDQHGRVIGVSTLLVTQGQNLAFAVPIDAVKPLLTAKKSTPLTKWQGQAVPGVVGAAAKAVERQIPHHELSLLNGCSADDIDVVENEISQAIGVGAPVYNDGNHEACYRIYSNAALALDHKVSGCSGARTALLAGVKRAEGLEGYTAKAWAMRDAFDGVLDVIGRKRDQEKEKAAALPPVPTRNVPHHPLSLLDGCSAEEMRQVAVAIEGAIDNGAPLYNEGNVEACFRIYQGAALTVQHQMKRCTGPKKALDAGINEAARRSSYADKAWAMRDAFDGLLEVIGRKLGN